MINYRGSAGFTQEEVDFIYNMTGGHPFYIQLLCYMLFNVKNRTRGHVDLEAVREQFLQRLQEYGDSKQEPHA